MYTLLQDTMMGGHVVPAGRQIDEKSLSVSARADLQELALAGLATRVEPDDAKQPKGDEPDKVTRQEGQAPEQGAEKKGKGK